MSLLDDVSIVVTPNGYKAGTLYGVLPTATLGSEQVTNGNFATDSDWTKGSSWSISGGKANYDAVTTASELRQLMSSIAVGKIIKIQFDILDVQAGKDAFFKLEIDGSPEAIFGYTTFSAGTYTYYHTIANAFDRLSFFPLNTSTGGAFSIDNVSVKEFTSSDMDVTRATAATRVDENGLVNYALGVEEVTNGDFSNGSTDWTPFGSTFVVSNANPYNGNDTALFTASGVNGAKVTQSITTVVGNTYHLSCYAQYNSGDQTQIEIEGVLEYPNGIGVTSSVTTFTFLQTSFTATSTTSVVAIRERGGNNNASCYLYGLSVKEVNNVPRIDYTGGGCPHILAEPQRTNLVTYSEDFSQSNWTNTDITFGANGVSPTGTNNANLIQTGSAGNDQVKTLVTLSATNTVTQSIYIKRVSGAEWVDFLIVKAGFSNSVKVWFNISTGVVGNNLQSGTTSLNNASIDSVGNNWYRLNITTTDTTNNTNFDIRVRTASANSSDTRFNNSSYYLWGTQLEEGSYTTSYIPTSGSTVTRNQDQFSRDGIGSLIGQTEGTFFIELSKPVLNPDSYYLISLNNAAANNDDNSLSIGFVTSNNKMFIRLQSNNSDVFSSTDQNSNANTFYKIAISYKSGASLIYIDGSPITPSSGSLSGTFTFSATLDNLSFDFDGNNTFPFYGKVKQLQVYKTALTDAQLTSLTT